MTRDEVKMLLVTLTFKFDTFADKVNRWNAQQKSLWIDSWFEDLAPYPFEEVKRAMAAYRDTANTAFAPSTSQIIGLIKSLASNELTATDAWVLAHQAICSSRDEMGKVFADLPPAVQRAIGNPRMLREWSELESEEIHNSIHPRFVRAYEAALKEEATKQYMAPEKRMALDEKVYKHIPQLAVPVEEQKGISEEIQIKLEEFYKELV